MTEDRHSLSRAAWMTVALLFPVALLNYLDRTMMANMKFSIMGDLDFGDPTKHEQMWGFLPAVFKWVYAVLSPVGGYLADRLSKKHVIVISLLVWSAVTWTTGHCTNYNELLVTRALMGISEACYIPAALALIADFHLGSTRSRAVGIHQMAIYIGVMLGGFSGHVADNPNLGWRWAFDACGLAGMAYAIPLFFLLKNAPRAAVAANRLDKTSPMAALGELLANRYFIFLVLCFTLPAIPAWVVKDWMPAILKDRFQIGQGVAGVSATLYINIASLFAAFFGGWLADKWMGRTIRGRIFVSSIGLFLLIPALFGIGNAGTLMIAIVFLALFGVGWGFFDCNNMPILCQITRPEVRATAYGCMNLVSMTAGGLADWGFGALRDHGVPLNLTFAVFGGAAAIAVGLMMAIRPTVSAGNRESIP